MLHLWAFSLLIYWNAVHYLAKSCIIQWLICRSSSCSVLWTFCDSRCVHCIHKSLLLVCILNQINPVHTHTTCVLFVQVFVIKEGVSYRIRIDFIVQREIVHGLKYVQKTYRMGMPGKKVPSAFSCETGSCIQQVSDFVVWCQWKGLAVRISIWNRMKLLH